MNIGSNRAKAGSRLTPAVAMQSFQRHVDGDLASVFVCELPIRGPFAPELQRSVDLLGIDDAMFHGRYRLDWL